jgi:hypothetical protein
MEKHSLDTGWDEDLTDEDLDIRLARLKDRASRSTPIEDADDLEEAIEQAADRVASQHATGEAGRSPANGNTLFAFVDIVSYSKTDARLQKLYQDNLISILGHSMAEAGVDPEQIVAQDQGDARLLRFPKGIDIAKVLAVMPPALNEELAARNHDMAEHARMQVRLAFSMGTSLEGQTGRVGTAPIAAARLTNSSAFRQAMKAAPQAQCGLVIDDYLYGEWVRQGTRADLNPDDYALVQVSNPDKNIETRAWMRLFGHSGQQARNQL